MNAPLRACPDPGDDRPAGAAGAGAELQAHLAACPACAEDWRAQREMARLGAALPFVPPEPAQQRRVRAALLSAVADDAGDLMPLPPPASVQRLRWWRPLLLAGAGGAVAAALLLLLFRPPTPPQEPLTAAPTAAPRRGAGGPEAAPTGHAARAPPAHASPASRGRHTSGCACTKGD